ncbi:hypothetical protein Tco_1572925, partial [Tanacetum coccineum]
GKSNSKGGEDPIRWTLLSNVVDGYSLTLPHLKGLQNGDIATSVIKQSRLPEKGINDGSSGLISSNVNNGQCQHKNIVTEGATIGNNAAVENDESDVDLP